MTDVFSVFTMFNRGPTIEQRADLGETISNVCVGLLRIGIGKTLKVERNPKSGMIFSEQKRAFTIRIAAVALLLFACYLSWPLTLTFTAIGFYATRRSTSYLDMLRAYKHPSPLPGAGASQTKKKSNLKSGKKPKGRVALRPPRARAFMKGDSPDRVGFTNSMQLSWNDRVRFSSDRPYI